MTSVTKNKRLPNVLDPFFFYLQFTGGQLEITKQQIMNSQVERQEAMYRKPKATRIVKNIQEKKKVARNHQRALQEREQERMIEE